MADEELRSQTFKVLKPVMGYVEGEEPTILDLDQDREEEYLADGSLEFVSGDKPESIIEAEKAEAEEAEAEAKESETEQAEEAEQAADAPVDYSKDTVEELRVIAADRNVHPEGTGKDGNILKEDYIAALEAADQKGSE